MKRERKKVNKKEKKMFVEFIRNNNWEIEAAKVKKGSSERIGRLATGRWNPRRWNL